MRSIVGLNSGRDSTFKVAEAHPSTSISEADIAMRLRTKRSSTYVNAMTSLDAGGHVSDQAAFDRVIEAITAELPGLAFDQFPLGIVSRCYLGRPYEVHVLDLIDHRIVQHYKVGEPLPGNLERARHIACYPAYAFVEVYTDSIRAVTEDGSVSVIGGK